MNRGKWIALAVVGPVFGVVFFFLLMGVLTPERWSLRDPATGVDLEYAHDDDEIEGLPHLVAVRVSKGVPGEARISVLYRNDGETRYGRLPLRPAAGGSFHVAELPASPIAHRVFYYFVVETAGGPDESDGSRVRPGALVLPAGAPEGGRTFTVRWEGRTDPWVMPLHIGLSALAAILLAHSLFFVVVFVAGRFREKGEGRRVLRAAWLTALAAFAAFFLGTLPVGIVANLQVAGASFEGWPFGSNATHTAAEGILLVWAALLLWRADLARARGNDRPRADRAFPFVFFAAVVVSAVAFLVPHA